MKPGTFLQRTRQRIRRGGAFTQGPALLAALLLAAPPVPAQSRAPRGSLSQVNRQPRQSQSWSGPRTSGTTSRTASASGSQRTTVAQGRGGQTATGSREVSRQGDTVTVDRTAQGSQGGSIEKQKKYEIDDGRVESVERDIQAQDRAGRTAEWEGKAERVGNSGVVFEGEGKNRYGQKVEAQGYGGRGYYGSGAVVDVKGGRYGSRTVAAWKPHGGPTYVTQLPYGHRPYNYYGRPYYGYGGVYYRPCGNFYYVVPPPYGYCCYSSSDVAAAFLLTVAGLSLLYSDGVYYEKTVVQGETQYQVVAPPPGAALPQSELPGDVARVTVGGVTYYYYANAFYKVATTGGELGFAVVEKPSGVVTVAALPDDVEPRELGSVTYLVAGGRYYMPYLDAAGGEFYVAVDPPGEATAVLPARSYTLTVPAGTALRVRLAHTVDSGQNRAGDPFQGFLDGDLVAGGHLVAVNGARVSGRVTDAVAGTGAGKAPRLVLELTEVTVADRSLPVVTDHIETEGKGKSPAGKIVGGALLGAGIGHLIDDGGAGAAVGAGVGALGGAAAASKAPGNQVTFAAGASLEFQVREPLIVERSVAVAASGI